MNQGRHPLWIVLLPGSLTRNTDVSIRFIFIFIILEPLYMLPHAINGYFVKRVLLYFITLTYCNKRYFFLFPGFCYILLESYAIKPKTYCILIEGLCCYMLKCYFVQRVFLFRGLCCCMLRCYFVQRAFFVGRVMLIHA